MTNSVDTPFAATRPLAELVDQGWELHAERPKALAAALRQRAAALPADADAAGAVLLAEHVILSHLNDPPALAGFLAALPAETAGSSAVAPAVQRARFTLAVLAGEPAPLLDDATRWRALQNVWAAMAADGRAAEALAMLTAEAPAARAHADPAARRALAACCNNLASELQEAPRTLASAGRDALMLVAAAEAAALWRSAGPWLHAERAEYRLARCHAALGDGDAALRHATACLQALDDHADEPEADAFERFFAHEALAWAHRARGDTAALALQRDRMRSLMADLTDASLRPWCDRALTALETPATA